MPQRKKYSGEDKTQKQLEIVPIDKAIEDRTKEVDFLLAPFAEKDISLGLDTSAVVTLIFKPLECFANYQTKTPQDIRDTFQLFQLITLKINEYMKYVPMKPDFCRLLGISMATFNRYKNQENSEYEDAINMVEDYIGSFTIQSAMQGSIKEISAVFATKTTLGWKDTPDQVVQNNIMVTDRSTSDMLSEYMARIPRNKDTGKIENNKEIN